MSEENMSNRDEEMIDPSHAADSAAKRAHGTHGRGHGDEEREETTTPEPSETRGSDRGGDAGWGSEASGGSVIDKRPPKK